MEQPHVVIVGGGFGGLNAARALAKKPVRVTLLDRANHHLFQPLLYQVAMAGVSPADIAQPIRSVLSPVKNCTVLLADVEGIDLARRAVKLSGDGELPYDFLIVAAGATTSYFGHAGWEAAAPGLKSIDDAIEIRQRVLLAFETAEREVASAQRNGEGDSLELARRVRQLLTFVVIGGGPTGVELAGALAELSKYVLAKDFRGIHPESAKVVLLEGGNRILASFPESLSQRAVEQLAELGAEVKTKALVTTIDREGVTLTSGESIPSAVVLWGAGVSASPIARTLGVPLDRGGRVIVGPDCSVPGHPEAYVIGDAACFTHQTGQPLPGVSQVAMQMARYVADAIAGSLKDDLDQRPPLPFKYNDKGSMATIGRSRAICDIKGMHTTGFLAWILWLGVHIWFLIGFRNRLSVLLSWFWSYLTYRRGARLITGRGTHELPALAPAKLPAPVPPGPATNVDALPVLATPEASGARHHAHEVQR